MTKLSDSFFSSKLGQNVASALENIFKQYTGTGKTDKFQEELEASEASNDRLAENAYERNVDFYERFESVPAQVRQYKEAGLNPALMYGSGASVSASNVAPSGSASASGGASDLLGTVLSSVFNFKKLDQDKVLKGRDQILEERRIKQQERYNDIIEGLYGTQGQKNLAEADKVSAEAARIRALFPLERDQIEANTKKLLDDLKTNNVQRYLMQSNISLNSAERGIKVRQAVLLEVQLKHADKYQSLVNQRLSLENQAIQIENDLSGVELTFARETLKNRIDSVDMALNDLIFETAIHMKDYQNYDHVMLRNDIDTGARAVGGIITSAAATVFAARRGGRSSYRGFTTSTTYGGYNPPVLN